MIEFKKKRESTFNVNINVCCVIISAPEAESKAEPGRPPCIKKT